MEKIYTNLEYTGNISSASVPVCWTKLLEGLSQEGDKLILVAFGETYLRPHC